MKKLTLLFFCTFAYINSYSQWWIPDEKYGDGQYWETDAINYQDYPYTTFKRHDNISIPQQIQNIRNLIIAGMPDCDTCPNKNEFQTLYSSLWKFATDPRPAVGGNPAKEASRLTAWSKALAFICFIGIDPDGNNLTSTQLENFGWNAENAIKDMNTEIASGEPGRLFSRGRELLQAVQAYDLLKACGRVKDDRNHSDLTPRDNIRQLARNLYNESNRTGFDRILLSSGAWRKNHGISVSAALGITAIVLNECGASYFFDGWKANNWARLGHWGMMKCIFDAGSESVSKRGGIYSYSEGPGYFRYGMLETALPFFVAFNNFVTRDHNTWTFPYGMGNVGANNYKNYMYDQDIINIFEWFHQIQLPDGSAPTYDNTGINGTSTIGIFDKKYNTGDSISNFDGDVDLRVDYIAGLGGLGEAGRIKKSNGSTFLNMTKFDDAGNIILRMNQDSLSNRQYFHMLYEKGIASDLGDFAGDTHEDNDVGSFILAVDRDQLAIDPAYRGWDKVEQTNHDFHHNEILFNSSGLNNNIAFSVNNIPAYSKITEYNTTPSYQSFSLNIAKQPSAYSSYTTYSGTGPYLTRNVNQIMLPNGKVYYLMNDYASGDTSIKDIKWQLNGNGNIEEGFLNNSSYKTFPQPLAPASELIN
jgi:hypothetical protein